jgi:hypothetical protein
VIRTEARHGRSSDDVPIITSKSPGSTIRLKSGPVYAVRSACTWNVTSTAWPGSSDTRANPVSSFNGRATRATTSRRYNCTTSSPARSPVFCTRTVAVNSPSLAISAVLSRRSPTSKLVYDAP